MHTCILETTNNITFHQVKENIVSDMFTRTIKTNKFLHVHASSQAYKMWLPALFVHVLAEMYTVHVYI